jgi:tetratricopeptide (TPR) repeat protein
MRQVGDPWGLAFTLDALAYFTLEQGDTAATRPFYEEALALRRTLGDRFTIAYTLADLAELEYSTGNYHRVAELCAEGLALLRRLGTKQHVVPWLLYRSGRVAQVRHDYGQAVASFREGVALSQELGFTELLAWCLAGLGGVASAQGRTQQATRVFGAVEALLETIDRVAPTARIEYDRDVAATRAQLDETTSATAWEEGRAMPLEQAIAYALEEPDS